MNMYASDLNKFFIKNRQHLKLATATTTALKQWPYSSKERVSWWFITAVTVAVIAAAVIVAAILVAPSFALACNYTCVSNAYLISTEIRKLTDSITDIGAKIDINREGGNLLY